MALKTFHFAPSARSRGGRTASRAVRESHLHEAEGPRGPVGGLGVQGANLSVSQVSTRSASSGLGAPRREFSRYGETFTASSVAVQGTDACVGGE